MEELQSEVLLLAARLLSYPDEEIKQEMMDYLSELDHSDEVKESIVHAVDSVYHIPMAELQETYVETFDLKTKLGLYLSAHEFGDSPKRGAALIKLQKIVNEAGFEREEGELADYMPMLYEFLGAAGDFKNKERLVRRLACVTQSILNQLPKENPFYPIVSLLMTYVFEPLTDEELAKMEQDKEQADLEELPYPIMYQ